MSTDFNTVARNWDNNDIHVRRSQAIAESLLRRLPIHSDMSALEFGAGTGILSFMLADRLRRIVMMDAASEMVAVMQEKVHAAGIGNLEPLLLDVTKEVYETEPFDLVFSQMALHHIDDTQTLIQRFYDVMKPDGFLAIADLYSEDGSFHGAGFSGHNGFDPAQLEAQMRIVGFHEVLTETCFTMQKAEKNYPIFLMIARK